MSACIYIYIYIYTYTPGDLHKHKFFSHFRGFLRFLLDFFFFHSYVFIFKKHYMIFLLFLLYKKFGQL